jgi:integrase/recombinase XerD
MELALSIPRDVESPITTADDLAAAFLAGYGPATRTAYARDLRCWGDFLAAAGVGVFDAHRVHVDAWISAAENGVAPATVARRLATLSGFYAYALDEGLIARSPVVRVRRPKLADESPRFGLDRDEMRRLLVAAEQD